jgi:hypothetical protein
VDELFGIRRLLLKEKKRFIEEDRPMWGLIKIPVEPLVPEAFEPFGHVIRTFEERQPDKVKGGYATNAYPVLA